MKIGFRAVSSVAIDGFMPAGWRNWPAKSKKARGRRAI